MKVDVHFEDGPISADIEAEDEDEFSDVLDELADFINDYHKMVNGDLHGTRFDWAGNNEQMTFDSIENSGSESTVGSESSEVVGSDSSEEESPDRQKVDSDISEDTSTDTEDDDTEETSDRSSSNAESEEYRPIIKETGLSESQLRKVIDCGDAESGPRILASNFLPGGSKQETTLNGTIVLLTLWKACHDEFWKNTADIIENLERSGLKDDRFKRVYQNDDWDSYIQKKGEKRGTELGIVPIGEDRGFELIGEMAEEAGV